jgi:hypothetical protein
VRACKHGSRMHAFAASQQGQAARCGCPARAPPPSSPPPLPTAPPAPQDWPELLEGARGRLEGTIEGTGAQLRAAPRHVNALLLREYRRLVRSEMGERPPFLPSLRRGGLMRVWARWAACLCVSVCGAVRACVRAVGVWVCGEGGCA